MMASLNRYFINYYKREERESHITWVGVEEWVWGWGWFLIINNKMAQGGNVAFQGQEHQHLFDQASNMQDSSIREESIKNLTFRSNSKQIQEDAFKFLAKYQPIYPSFPLQTLLKSPHLNTKHYKESTYYGEIVNGRKQGLGIMIYNNKKIYQGQWENDKKHGNGSENFPNGCAYRGNYQNGKPEGLGCYTWANGETYQGKWRKGERHGSGLWQGTNGEVYNGQWRSGKPEGFGVLTQANGDVYEGEFKEALKHGVGVEKFANLDMYRGHYSNGTPSGQGTYYWADKSYFKGNFLNGLREGKGLWKKGPGECDKYEGSYKNDKKWGYGQFTWQSGNFYKGNYEGDVRSGYGEMYWLNGSFYKGEWVNGVQHGQGEIFIPQYGYKRAIFSNNEIAEVLEERLVKKVSSKSKYSSDLGNKEEGKGKDKESYRFKMSRSFRKKQSINPIRESMTEKIQFSKEKTTQSITLGKQESKSIKQQKPKEKQGNKVRILKQNRRFYEKDISNSKRQILQKQPVKNYQMQSLDLSKNLQKPTPQKQKPQITWKSKPKQRILHSSFYLYKLNTWHHKDSTSSRNTPSCVNTFEN